MNYNENNPSTEKKPKHPQFLRLMALLLCCIGAAAFYWVAVTSNKIPAVSTASSSTSSMPVSSAVVSSAVVSSSPASSSAPSSSAAASSNVSKPEEVLVDLKAADKPLWVKVSIPEQRVFVYDASDRMVKNFICSTGLEGSDTPTGTFTVSDRGKSFFSPQYQEGAYYWTRFKGSFLFHSIPFDKNEKIEPEEADKLGTKASHGCVRLAIEDAKWIYDNVPRGTKVVIE
ncbi:MAG: L,D-transpeptidase [Ruminococcaceae bacterium]|nr:L,D-transpeptidase [Oscillospiraceae bacterium]HHV32289.1 L,D-transpeptidase [Clostridiales bacterium]